MARWGLPPSYSILWIQKIKDKLIPCSGAIASERSHHYAKKQQDKAKTLRVDKINNMVLKQQNTHLSLQHQKPWKPTEEN